MSRIGNKPIALPEGVEATITGQRVEVKGPKGTLSWDVHPAITVAVEDGQVTVSRPNDNKENRALHGTTRALVQNLILGVSQGFKKDLKMIGVGYRAQLQGQTLVVNAGYSNPVEVTIPSGIEVTVNKNTDITISGIDKQVVGEFAANIRAIRKPEPYLGKGIRYVDEYVRRKEGKTAK